MIVVDASALVWLLTDDGAAGKSARAALARDHAWMAPEHWKLEVVSAVRGLARKRKIAEKRAVEAVRALPELSVAAVETDALLPRIWELRGNVTPYDAAYVAAAELHACPLVTGDARLRRAPGLRCELRMLI